MKTYIVRVKDLNRADLLNNVKALAIDYLRSSPDAKLVNKRAVAENFKGGNIAAVAKELRPLYKTIMEYEDDGVKLTDAQALRLLAHAMKLDAAVEEDKAKADELLAELKK